MLQRGEARNGAELDDQHAGAEQGGLAGVEMQRHGDRHRQNWRAEQPASAHRARDEMGERAHCSEIVPVRRPTWATMATMLPVALAAMIVAQAAMPANMA